MKYVMPAQFFVATGVPRCLEITVRGQITSCRPQVLPDSVRRLVSTISKKEPASSGVLHRARQRSLASHRLLQKMKGCLLTLDPRRIVEGTDRGC